MDVQSAESALCAMTTCSITCVPTIWEVLVVLQVFGQLEEGELVEVVEEEGDAVGEEGEDVEEADYLLPLLPNQIMPTSVTCVE